MVLCLQCLGMTEVRKEVRVRWKEVGNRKRRVYSRQVEVSEKVTDGDGAAERHKAKRHVQAVAGFLDCGEVK